MYLFADVDYRDGRESKAYRSVAQHLLNEAGVDPFAE
jgi:uncharacterized protein (DUF1330 family)